MRGFDGHKRVKGRKRQVLVDTLGLIMPRRGRAVRHIGPARGGAPARWPAAPLPDDPHRDGRRRPPKPQARAGAEAARGLGAGHHQGGQRAFKITGLTWIVERSLAWLGRNRRLSKDYEYQVQTSEALIDVASIRIMLGRLAPV